MNIVVGLGDVPPDAVEGELGAGCEFVPHPTEDDLARAVGAIVRANVTIDKSVLDRMPRLRVLARTGVGTERVDLDETSARGIPVVITPGSNTAAVAEGALALILHLVKNIGRHTNLVREGRWSERDNIPVGDIDGAIIGIVGWGRIGQRLGGIIGAMGGTIRVFDPFADVPDDIRVESIDDIWRECDVVSLHVPLTADNHRLVDANAFRHMRPGTILVNCSRGPLVDLGAAFDALTTGTLGGLGLDVFDDEPAEFHPVFDHPAVALTPHVMGLSRRAAAQTFADAAAGIRAVLEGRQPRATAR